jgi:hypothetical protein
MIAGIIVWAGTFITASELSTDVYPSEDELREALELGLIDEDRYAVLLDILREGIDSTNAYLFEEIPGLPAPTDDSVVTDLSNEQARAFRSERSPGRMVARITHRYYQELEREGRGRYRTSVVVQPTANLEIAARIERSLSGRERVTGRSLHYHSTDGPVREIVIGSFSKRLGLGMAAGYRGKLLCCSDRLDTESGLFPDYGGFNGAEITIHTRGWGIASIVSATRDDDFRLVTAATEATREWGRLRAGIVAARNNVIRRRDHAAISDVKLGPTATLRYRKGVAGAEMIGQFDYRPGFAGFVVSGYHRDARARIYYRAWRYTERYLDLSGGSPSGPLSARDTIPEIGLYFGSRRTGTTGGSVRLLVSLTDRLSLEPAAVVSVYNRDTLRTEYIVAASHKLSPAVTIRADYLSRLTRRRAEDAGSDDRLRRIRTELSYEAGPLTARFYIAHTSVTGEPDRGAIFGRIRLAVQKVGDFELWSNLGRFNLRTRQLDYWYLYFRHALPTGTALEPSLKIAHRYSRNYSDRHTTTVILEARATW